MVMAIILRSNTKRRERKEGGEGRKVEEREKERRNNGETVCGETKGWNRRRVGETECRSERLPSLA